MTIKLKNNLVNYEEKRTAFVNAVKNEETQEIQNKAYVEMVDAMAADIMDQAKKEARQEADQYISASSKVTVNELTDVYKYHSVKENGKPLNVAGEVTLLVNPTDAWDVKKQYTSLNANGVYVTALPYNLNIIESLFVPEKKAISYVAKRYDALVGGALNISTFDQTLAFEDLNLYAAKQFAYGKAKDEKAAAVWTLNIKPTDQTPEG
ncbi:hypothetical protein [Listeria monocytogenes]|uniref:hypothetical protein n=1 Tax=Listeria monocytogenes TaxID=1639 RepID=UPI0009807C19|nr:hypothetical protein [Listeria monocytogenes]AQP85349.1 hypothetical protein B0X17_06525 [Listeria monocytogenes]